MLNRILVKIDIIREKVILLCSINSKFFNKIIVEKQRKPFY